MRHTKVVNGKTRVEFKGLRRLYFLLYVSLVKNMNLKTPSDE